MFDLYFLSRCFCEPCSNDVHSSCILERLRDAFLLFLIGFHISISLANEQENSFKGFNIRRDKIKQSYDIQLFSFEIKNDKLSL